MRALQRNTAPVCLEEFEPTGDGPGDWDKFRDAKTCYNDCRVRLAKAQDGLCAYCEINVRFPINSEPKYWDFQVEHIWPKGNYADRVFQWSNFLGCCQGGTSGGHQPESGHRVQRGERQTCGQSKGEDDPTSLLNPYEDLRASDLVYTFDTKGVPSVHPMIRPEISQKAENSLSQLNLGDSRLNRLRKSLIDDLCERVLTLDDTLDDLEESMSLLCSQIRASIETMGVPEFISVYRDFFNKGSHPTQNAPG